MSLLDVHSDDEFKTLFMTSCYPNSAEPFVMSDLLLFLNSQSLSRCLSLQAFIITISFPPSSISLSLAPSHLTVHLGGI